MRLSLSHFPRKSRPSKPYLTTGVSIEASTWWFDLLEIAVKSSTNQTVVFHNDDNNNQNGRKVNTVLCFQLA